MHKLLRRKAIKKLTQSGIAHLMVPLLVIVSFGVVGTGIYIYAHAATIAVNTITSGLNTKLCLDASEPVNTGKVDINACNKSDAQAWQYNVDSYTPDGGYAITTIKLANENMCVGVNSSQIYLTKHESYPVQTFVCRSQKQLASSNQQWRYFDSELVNVNNPTLCMTAPSKAGGTGLVLQPCANQFCNPTKGNNCPKPVVKTPATQAWNLKGYKLSYKPPAHISAATFTFTLPGGTVLQTGQKTAYIGVNAPLTVDGVKLTVSKVQWFKKVNGKYELISTTKPNQLQESTGLYEYKWSLVGLQSGTYTWQAEVYSNTLQHQPQLVQNNRGKTQLDITVSNPSVSGTFTQTEGQTYVTSEGRKVSLFVSVKPSQISKVAHVYWQWKNSGTWTTICTTTTHDSKGIYSCGWTITNSQKGLDRLRAYVVDTDGNSQAVLNPKNHNADYLDLNIKLKKPA